MYRPYTIFTLFTFLISCSDNDRDKLKLSEEFKEYWYSGKAEITSYSLEQARYGEMRKGEAVLIYVTEDFLPAEQVKAVSTSSENTSVLKLNATKNFNTGIYPYSIMQSSFYPLDGQPHALKVSASIQEWCGQAYMQLNNRNGYDIAVNSYFAGEADIYKKIDEENLENEIWNLLRVHSNDLPVGEFEMIPSFEYLRLTHKKAKPYAANGEYYTMDDLNVYELEYPKLKRSLKIYFSRSFPFSIEKWEESYPSDASENAEILTTKAVKKQRIRTDYWNKNSNKDLPLRDKLELN